MIVVGRWCSICKTVWPLKLWAAHVKGHEKKP